jgi:glycosyltransferase involved in cell wall biosynthesis
MRVMVLPRYSRMGASSRLRMLQYVDIWSQSDADCEIYPLLNDAYLKTIYANEKVSLISLARAYGRRLQVLRQVAQFDLVWLEKELFPNFPSWFEWWLSRSGVPYLVDYDDPIFHNYDVSVNPFKRLLKSKIGNVMRYATLVVPGNTYLARHALDSGASQVEIFPTVVDLLHYPPPTVSTRNASCLTVGWIGSPSTVKFLRPLLPVMARLAEIFPLELTVIGGDLSNSRYDFIRCKTWHEHTEAEEISRFDIGIMPLPDEPWARGKNGGKLIQYMACGKPVVASPVGVNADIVQEGRNGYLASAEDAWFEALSNLLSNQELRRTMGAHGRTMVEEKYCLQVTAPRLLHLFRQLVSTNKSIKSTKCAE